MRIVKEYTNKECGEACAEAVRNALFKHEIVFDKVTYNENNPLNVYISGLYEVDKYADTIVELISDETGFSNYFTYYDGIMLDISEEYEDEFGEIRLRVSREYLRNQEGGEML